MARIRSALFLDFDNIFGGLLGLDRTAALRLANQPMRLLERLVSYGLAEGDHRDLLVRRAYLNPAGRLMDEQLGNDSGWLYLQKFRPFLTRAGFEVIDCPSLTNAHKNAADIRIVIDVLTTLERRASLDEVIIASSDADFSPLLQRLRADDLRTCILTAGATAPAYAAIAHQHLDEEEVIRLIHDEVPVVQDSDPWRVDEDGGSGPAAAASIDLRVVEEGAIALVRQLVADAQEPLLLSNLGLALHRQNGESIRSSRWFGANTLSAFAVRSVPGLALGPEHVWDPERHAPPASSPEVVDPTAGAEAELFEQVRALTDLPRLAPEVWPTVFEVLAEQLDGTTFHLSEASASARDELALRGSPVGRQALAFVLKGAHWGGAEMVGGAPLTPDELRNAFLDNLVSRAAASGLPLAEEQRKAIQDLLRGDVR